MDELYTVFGREGRIPCRIRPFKAQHIKAWRQAEQEAGRPHSVEGFYLAHGVCPVCAGAGVVMIGWRKPMTEAERESAAALQLEELPTWDVCGGCDGAGTCRGGSGTDVTAPPI